MIRECIAIHQSIYHSTTNIRTFFSPGRVNLIGEHIDYNGGYVMPIAISLGNIGCIQLRDDSFIKLYSENFKSLGVVTCDLDHLEIQKEHGWANFAKGVILYLKNQGFCIDRGMNITVFGNLPIASGLSSSASIEALFAVMMKEVFKLDITQVALAQLAQKVENNYIGLNCGIMDQFIILNAEKEKAMLLNTNTLAFKNVSFDLGEYEIVVINSKVARGLVDSKYNERRKECNTSLESIQKQRNVDYLCDLTPEELAPFESSLGPLLYKRSKHAVFEQDRTIKAFAALNNQDVLGFAQLLSKSHESLSKDYEVSTKELDVLVEYALLHGSIGSRMTGAGFGGCTVNIVKKDEIKQFMDNVKQDYYILTGKMAEFYVFKASTCASEIEVEPSGR